MPALPPAASGLSTQNLPSAPAPAPAVQKPADVNKPVGIWQPPHYDEGFILVSTPDSAPLPYLLKLNHVSQFKYTNSLAVHSTYLTHLGVVTDVNKRNDFQLTRDVFYFSGYVFDKRLDYNIILYTSTADLTAAAAGYVGFVFNKAFALRAGFFSLPQPARHDRHLPLLRGHRSQHGGRTTCGPDSPRGCGPPASHSPASTTSR